MLSGLTVKHDLDLVVGMSIVMFSATILTPVESLAYSDGIVISSASV
jgi:hypothetical protein